MSTTSPRPSIAEIRAVCQPPEIIDRVNAEHWAGRWYGRRASPYLTRLLLAAGISANTATWAMVVSGVAAAAVLVIPGWWPAVVAVLLIQVQLLLDCSDGELARWNGSSSPVGIYLDRLGHYVTEAALVAALGVRCDGGFDRLGGWTTLGLALAVIVLLIKSETDLVDSARARGGLGPVPDVGNVHRRGGVRTVRGLLRYLPFYRAFVAIEFSLLVLVAATIDAAQGSLVGSRVLLVALCPIAVLVVVGHLISILASNRLR